MKLYTLVLFLFCFTIGFSQYPGSKNAKTNDTLDPPIELYKIISVKNDTTIVDTSLTILKDYKFNYLRKDNFELLPFSNTGQTYTQLSPDRDLTTTFPKFGARARHYNFMEVEDIDYYRVPSPLTELYFKTVPEQGQQLDAFITLNTSEKLNFSVAYKGVRALGKFQHMLTSTGNFRATLNYQSDSRRYLLKSHFVTQDLLNEENGGLTAQALQQYIDKEQEFDDRSVLEVNFENAESSLFGKRFYLNHNFAFAKNPSNNALRFGHIFDFTYEKFVFKQDAAATSIFGDAFESTNLNDKTRLEKLYNQLYVQLGNSRLGNLKAYAGYTDYSYGYNSVAIIEGGARVTNKLTGQVLEIGGEYATNIGDFYLSAKGSLNLSGEIPGNHISATAGYDFNEDNQLRFGIKQNSRLPNFNFLLYQSDYINYNWQNNFSTENSQSLFAQLYSQNLLNISGSLDQIQNYAFFALNANGDVKPFQYDNQVRYFKVKAEKEFDFGLFGSFNTIAYQDVLNGSEVFNFPELVTRNSVYYKDYWFDRALYLQTGFTFKYFSKYQMSAYDPILAEFYIQDEQELGGFPVVDFFFNAKVDQARIFFKLEHLNAIFDGNNNFSAPDYPYTDFLLRFGLVWNFFL